MSNQIDIEKLREAYKEDERIANSMRGKPGEYRYVTGFCPVYVIEMQARKITELLDNLESERQRTVELDVSETKLITERDSAEEALSNMYEAATGERPEWSNKFQFADAIADVAAIRGKTL